MQSRRTLLSLFVVCLFAFGYAAVPQNPQNPQTRPAPGGKPGGGSPGQGGGGRPNPHRGDRRLRHRDDPVTAEGA